jgi:DNA polymerase I-like protein with 3'-5' exonuclease and polymerase domains
VSNFPYVNAVNITKKNLTQHLPAITQGMLSAKLIGLDIETEDSERHAGLLPYNGKKKKLVFDTQRTRICGLSLWPDGWPQAYYFNIGHADVADRLDWSVMKAILDIKPARSNWVIHNANFERTMLSACEDYDVKDYICTLVMAVSAYSPDEYDIEKFMEADLGGIERLMPAILAETKVAVETSENRELLSKIISKTSVADHSYNGYVASMSYGYGLKQAVKSFFDYDMVTFEQALRGKKHMGELTSEEVVEYGCDDAIWCVRLYHRLLQYMLDTNPLVVPTFFGQELPLVESYSEAWREGVVINAPAVSQKQDDVRLQYADTTRRLKAMLKQLLPFDAEFNESLAKHDPKYVASYGKSYRQKLLTWINTPDEKDAFKQASQLKGAIPDAWAKDLDKTPPKTALNLTFWMCMRVLMYDLCRRPKVILEHGKVQSDAYARGRVKEGFINDGKTLAAEVMTLIGELATIEQVAKLYLTPYMALVDPETSKLHPVIGSELATRRTAMSTPNAQQLAKRGESVYVRGFYEADYPDHVIVSIDWSQIELVLIGEFSGDPYFRECYGQTPYRDLHEIAAADCLAVDVEQFRALKKAESFLDRYGADSHLLTNPKGEKMAPGKAFKYWRVEVGKGSNFSYWYSGALSQVGERLGWTKEEMFEASDRYRQRFEVAEAWRISQIHYAQEHGYVLLPDGHRRTRFEATARWADIMRSKFRRWDTPGVKWFADQVVRRIQSRANNQSINALIQGSCATLAKRSINTLRQIGATADKRLARFMFPIHDELVFSVQRDFVPEFIQVTQKVMNHHPDIIKNLKMDCSPSIGLTFAPWTEDKARWGQLELREIPKLHFVNDNDVDGPLPVEQWSEAVDWLFKERAAA